VETVATTLPNTLDSAGRPTRTLRLGLVNNMPDGALKATERQFRSLFEAASPGRPLDLVLFDMPQIRRDPDLRARMRDRYRRIEDIACVGLDALVVTGADPGETVLRDSPLWPGLSKLVDQAVSLRLPTLWSCLAAHAAVEHLDGIKRRPLNRKHSGVFQVAPVAADSLLKGLEPSWRVPHSRRNGLDEAELVAAGYEILTRSEAVGVDVFIRRGPPPFLFCQGHPEYDRNTLLLEYKRDFRAYLDGEREDPPDPPEHALPTDLAARLARLTEAARNQRSPALMAEWPSGSWADQAFADWKPSAVRLCANWLRSVA
jgi:homoserine O-succinyltransferase